MISIISPLCVLSNNLFETTKIFFEDLKKGMQPEDELSIVDNDSSIGQMTLNTDII